ncbi:hypothetical protein Tco_0831283 [Tanacetum coccineum]
MAQMRAAAPSTYHPLLPSGTPPLIPIPLPILSTSRRADTPRPGSVDTVETRVRDTERRMMAALEVVNLLQRGSVTRTLEARITVLETEARRHEWQRQDADDHAVEHIMRTQALEARARMDTLDTSSSS